MVRIINNNSRGFQTLGNHHGIITGLFTQGDIVPYSEDFVSECSPGNGTGLYRTYRGWQMSALRGLKHRVELRADQKTGF